MYPGGLAAEIIASQITTPVSRGPFLSTRYYTKIYHNTSLVVGLP